MRRTQQTAALVLAAALAAPAAADARTPAQLLAQAAPVAPSAGALLAQAAPVAPAPAARILADADPLVAATLPEDARELTPTPLADRGDEAPAAVADAGDPERLLAQAPAAAAQPPATRLPYTGTQLWVTLLAGAGLALAGTGLRLRLAEPAARA